MEGSAFVVSHTQSATVLVTNSHVVAGSSSVTLKWSDGNQQEASVIGNAGAATPQTDLALIQVQGVRGRALVLKSTPPNVGADVVAIGAPQGLEFSLTRGVVSSLRDNGQIIQIDAPINPGNSGGPILDNSGCVVGMATFKLDQSEGLNFAVSSTLIDSFLRSSLGSGAGSAVTSSPPTPITPPPSNRSGNSPSTPFSSPTATTNCWFQEAQGSTQLSPSNCQIVVQSAPAGRLAFLLVDPRGSKRMIYLNPDKTAEVYLGGQRFDGEWLKDQDGDFQVELPSEVFAFSPPA